VCRQPEIIDAALTFAEVISKRQARKKTRERGKGTREGKRRGERNLRPMKKNSLKSTGT
jgi:hypothetical protein